MSFLDLFRRHKPDGCWNCGKKRECAAQEVYPDDICMGWEPRKKRRKKVR